MSWYWWVLFVFMAYGLGLLCSLYFQKTHPPDRRRADRRTIERWRRWWRDSFTATPFWQGARAAFMPPVEHDRLPASLIERFTGGNADRMIALLRFVAPMTRGRARAS